MILKYVRTFLAHAGPSISHDRPLKNYSKPKRSLQWTISDLNKTPLMETRPDETMDLFMIRKNVRTYLAHAAPSIVLNCLLKNDYKPTETLQIFLMGLRNLVKSTFEASVMVTTSAILPMKRRNVNYIRCLS
uniref:BLM10_mid domain-containing protein n=1 Tax=Panagrellus redivivus TaxID=6233 RepID=A0A7E4ZQH8_PANRE